jgi:hypothetical protein
LALSQSGASARLLLGGTVMAEFFNDLLTSGPFMPHGHCYLWEPALVWLHGVSDALIALAYYVMSVMLSYVVCTRQYLPCK